MRLVAPQIKDRRIVLYLIWVVTVILAILFWALWTNQSGLELTKFGEAVENQDIATKLLYSAVLLFILVLMWANYIYQKRSDESGGKVPNKVRVFMQGFYKYSGFASKVTAILAWLAAFIFFALGIAILFFGLGTDNFTSRIVFGVIFIILSVVGFVKGRIYWWRSRSLSEGRFYS